MSYGLLDTFKLDKFVKPLKKITKLRKKYESTEKVVTIDGQVKLEFNTFTKIITIFSHNNKLIAIDYGIVAGSFNTLKSGLTLGIAKGPYRLLTNDESVDKEYIDQVYEKIKRAVDNGSIESRFKSVSDRKWSK